MAPLSNRDLAVLRLAVGDGHATVRGAAERLYVSHAVAGGALRTLERAGYVADQLVGGGVIGYTPTAQGLRRVDQAWREPVVNA